MDCYRNNLIREVIDKSESDTWEDAVEEWELEDSYICKDCSETCVCGKIGIRDISILRNIHNNNQLKPVGSCCVKKFQNVEMLEDMNNAIEMYPLIYAVENKQFIKFNREFFSRKVLKILLEDGAFKPNKYNNNNATADYDFLLRMFNKRNKASIREWEHRKIKALLMTAIIPHLRKQIKEKRNAS